MITFPRSKILEFYRADPDWKAQGKRLGEAFVDFVGQLDIKTPEDNEVINKLSLCNSGEATKIIIAHTDWES